MDNFTHSLVGWALGQTGLKRQTRKGLAALILGANMPDIDIFFGWVPWVPLATHRGFTHGVLAAFIMPPMLAGLLWLLDRWQQSRGESVTSGLPMHVGWLLGLSYMGAITHPLLDLQTSYAIQIFSPFSNVWFHTETLFIIDVWIWTGLAFAIWLSRRREKRGGAWRRPALVALVVLCTYIGLNGVITRQAMAALRRETGDAVLKPLFANEEPVRFWRRSLLWRQDGMIGRAGYDPLASLTHISDLQPLVPDNMADPAARRAMRASEEVVTFMRWSVMPMASIVRERCRTLVELDDARFAGRGGPFVHMVELPVEGAGCPAAKVAE